MSHADTIPVRVVAVEQVTPQIKHFKLAAVDGSRLPAFSGGSHIIVVMNDVDRVHRNPYSLLGVPAQLETYEIAVRRMELSRGGSHFMHDSVSVGSTLEIASLGSVSLGLDSSNALTLSGAPPAGRSRPSR